MPETLDGPDQHGETAEVPLCTLGLDVGSTTVKAVLRQGDETLFEAYRRHHADVRGELATLLKEVAAAHPDLRVRAAVTGSGGLSVATVLDVPFVQEVVAGTTATQTFHPEADVVIELGGEDAKLTYLKPTPEQRMNGTCAGGTGAFIDQMATLLDTDAAGLDVLAEKHTRLYPIASRCGVFAKSDLQPLINEGAAHEDLAASIFTAVATQTIAGLANGRPLRGNVLFLGGPLFFLPQLREAFRERLEKVETFTCPEGAQLYVALGAALLAARPDRRSGQLPGAIGIEDLADRLLAADGVGGETPRMRPLFKDQAERDEFDRRHAAEAVPQATLDDAHGEVFLGIDAGSTTIKAVLMDADRRILFSHYASNEGDPVTAASDIVRHLHEEMPADARIARSCVTGYGEGLVRAALRIDEGEVETMAHYRAAELCQRGVDSVIDIGGQDMKYLRIRGGTVDSISVNEACSSGCGSFLQTFARTMETSVEDFAAAAVEAPNPVDLGSRCTVFMNSSVKQAQKEGARLGDISAGLSYSVVRNALYKVIKLRDPADLGTKVVVQGGTFLNDAVLRAFELLTGREVVRPDIAGLMGAYGAALTAQLHHVPGTLTDLIGIDELEALTAEVTRRTCRFCQNHCPVTITKFSTGEEHVSGNRCERGASLVKKKEKSEFPNVSEYKYKRIFSYRRLTDKAATRGEIGIPRVLNMYENYPLWFTILTHLKFKVMISGRSNHDLFEKGMETIPSENVCYPAKLVHGHIESLLDKGVKTIWYPCVIFEQDVTGHADNCFTCPVVGTYPEAIRHNVDRIGEDGARILTPFLNLSAPQKLAERLVEVFADWDVTLEEATEAVQAGFEEDRQVKLDVREAGREALNYMDEHHCEGIVLAGRPYHVDPEVNHGIPEMINTLGMAVLTEDSIVDPDNSVLPRPLRVRDQWPYHSRLYEAAALVAHDPRLHLVQLTSFGCGIDAITGDEVQEILERNGDVYTSLKIDEVSNLGAARIRIRSLQAAAQERSGRRHAEIDTATAAVTAADGAASDAEPDGYQTRAFTKEMAKAGYTVLMPQMAPVQFHLIEAVLKKQGLNMKLIDTTTRDDLETGLTFVHNDACYPALVVIGSLIHQFTSGQVDPDRAAVGITQTGGMCRATNYAALLRKGLADAGYGQVPVMAISMQGIEKHTGLPLTLPLIHSIVRAIAIGDALQRVLLRVRPYEAVPGSAMELYRRWDAIAREYLTDGTSTTLTGARHRLTYKRLVSRMIQEFDEFPLTGEPRRPQVGIVGEILVKFHPDANNHAVKVIEDQGCEAVLPGLMQFFEQAMATGDWTWKNLGVGQYSRWGKKAMLDVLALYQRPIRAAYAASTRFTVPETIFEMAERSTEIAPMGHRAGEGWYLTAEIMDMIESGCPNIICVQPFACLPNHVAGKAMFRPLRRRYPHANIVSIDYDPGASAVNQLNRITLMISTAIENHHGGDVLQGLHDDLREQTSGPGRRGGPVPLTLRTRRPREGQLVGR